MSTHGEVNTEDHNVMKAIVYDRYGGPEELRLDEVERPVPKENEVLVRIHATTVTAGDCEVRRFDIQPLFWLPVRLIMGLIRPRVKILGQEVAGEVVAVGNRATRFREGDKVFGPTNVNMGAYAEYICLPSSHHLAPLPSGLSFTDAVTIPVGGLNALYFLRKADIQPGESVLINGAGGSIGTYGIQIAKSLGAVVTAVDNTGKLATMQEAGADSVVDYTRDDFAAGSKRYDVIFDVAGKTSFGRMVSALADNGRLLLSNPRLNEMLRGSWITRTSSRRVFTGLADESSDDLTTLAQMIMAGTLRPVIDRIVPLGGVPDAHRYVEAGLKKGCLVVSVAGTNDH